MVKAVEGAYIMFKYHVQRCSGGYIMFILCSKLSREAFTLCLYHVQTCRGGL